MRKNLNIKLLIFISIMITILLNCLTKVNTVYADSSDSIEFSVEALDENGQSNERGFYHFVGEPGKQEMGHLRIYNSSNQEMRINIEANSAYTNINGIPSYSHNEVIDNTLKHPFHSLVNLNEKKVVLPPNSSQEIKIPINYPNESWDGQILGGIRVTQEKTSDTNQTISNEIAYTIGVLLTQKGKNIPENNLELNEVQAAQRNYRNYIEANMQNTEAVIINELSVEAKIYSVNKEEAVYEYSAQDMRMAPNSNFDLGIPTGDVSIQPGEYRLELTAIADDKEYHFEKKFEIERSKANSLNSSAVNVEENTNNKYVFMVVLVLIVVVGGIILFYRTKLNSLKEVRIK
ncbi:cell surface protein [Enterococcus casseliflavus]|nr:hypothetical protein RU99_GL001701 [Enterococcus casseliflavus]STQ30079.1 cell surface protein [Enterococcus casseliflavus]